MYSFMSGKHSQEFVHLADVFKFAVDSARRAHGDCPIIAADSYYMCKEARHCLRKWKVPYHVSVGSQRIPSDIASRLQRKVQSHGMWAACHDGIHGETILHYWDPDPEIGKKYLLSTILKRKEGNNPQVLQCWLDI